MESTSDQKRLGKAINDMKIWLDIVITKLAALTGVGSKEYWWIVQGKCLLLWSVAHVTFMQTRNGPLIDQELENGIEFIGARVRYD